MYPLACKQLQQMSIVFLLCCEKQNREMTCPDQPIKAANYKSKAIFFYVMKNCNHSSILGYLENSILCLGNSS